MADNGAVKVAINNLSFYYGDHQALKNISLRLYANAFATIVSNLESPNSMFFPRCSRNARRPRSDST